jgi:hypothetical protein
MAHRTDLLSAQLGGEASGLMLRVRGMYPPVTLVIEGGWTLGYEDDGKFQCLGSSGGPDFQSPGRTQDPTLRVP